MVFGKELKVARADTKMAAISIEVISRQSLRHFLLHLHSLAFSFALAFPI